MKTVISVEFVLISSFFASALTCSSMFAKEGLEPRPEQTPESCTATEFYHEESGRCYSIELLNEPGPCGPNMVLSSVNGSPKFLKCECRHKYVRAPMVYHAKTNQCYELYSQGPCDRQKWIQLEGNKPTCAPNPCVGYHSQVDKDLSSGEVNVGVNSEDLVVWFMNACTTLGRPCPYPQGAKVAFGSGTTTLRCVRSFSPLAVGAISAVSCPKNSYRTPDGKGCQEAIDFDFF